MKLSTARNRVLKEANKIIFDSIAKELGVESFSMDMSDVGDGSFSFNTTNCKFIEIDGHRITNIEITEYGNLHCSIGKQFPIKYLRMFGRAVVELLEKGNYKGRSNDGIHVVYFNRFYNDLTKEDLKSMFKTGKGWQDERFRNWLLGRFANSTNNLPWEYKFTRKELKDFKY